MGTTQRNIVKLSALALPGVAASPAPTAAAGGGPARVRGPPDTLAWFRGQPADRQATMRAGLSLEREAALLADWKA